MPTERTLCVAHGIRRNAEKPRECALVDEAYVRSPPPRLEKDDRGQILRERPIGGSPEAIDVDRLCMSLEQGAEGRGVAPDSVTPQLSIGHGPHTLGVSARDDEFPGRDYTRARRSSKRCSVPPRRRRTFWRCSAITAAALAIPKAMIGHG